MPDPPAHPRTVKPRKRVASANKPIIVIDGGYLWLERSPEPLPVTDLPAIVRSEPSSLIVCQRIGEHLLTLDKHFTGNEQWQYRVTPRKRETMSANGKKHRSVRYDTIVNFFGFSGTKARKQRDSLYHYPVDPVAMYDRTIHELRPGNRPTFAKLYEWALEVRAFLVENGLRASPTSGGVAAQLLKDARFYPEARRKVPKATNRTARPHLRGNHYRLYCDTNKVMQATYLDMTSAHHHVASNLKFPNGNSLHVKGYFQNLPNRQWRKTPSGHGLHYCAINVPHYPKGTITLPMFEHAGYRFEFLYSNEVEYAKETGVLIDYVIASWATSELDAGLNAYARWAIARLAEATPLEKQWLKPTLLATYGILASKPRQMEVGFHHCKGGTPTSYSVGSGRLTAAMKRTTHEVEMPVCNVIHRGMIEAETRLEAVRVARHLQTYGHTVLGVYADSVFVAAGTPLPLLPAHWTVKAELDRLVFHSATAFSSKQLTKLPGVPREGRERLSRRDQWRALTASRLAV